MEHDWPPPTRAESHGQATRLVDKKPNVTKMGRQHVFGSAEKINSQGLPPQDHVLGEIGGRERFSQQSAYLLRMRTHIQTPAPTLKEPCEEVHSLMPALGKKKHTDSWDLLVSQPGQLGISGLYSSSKA